MRDQGAEGQPPAESSAYPRARRAATVREARALAHPLRQRILRLCLHQELTNKQLADRLSGEPGALETPYRSTGQSWWLHDPLANVKPDASFTPIEAFQDELREAGPGSVQLTTRFTLHLSPEDVATLDRRILAILDEYVETEDQRLDQPALGGIIILHRLAG